MAKFNFVLTKGTDVNATLEMEATPAEVAQMLTTSRENLKDFIDLLNEAKSTAKELYGEFKPMFQRRAAAALDRDNASWAREEEEKDLRHQIEMERLRKELAELKAGSVAAEIEKDKEDFAKMREELQAARAEAEELNKRLAAARGSAPATADGIVARIPNDGDFSRRVNTTAGNETSSGVRVVSVGSGEIHSRRIAETTATVR